MLHGILIEGTDYAGKTTVCGHVARLVEAAGVRSRVGHCYVHEQPILDFFLEEAKRSEDLRQIDWFYSANILIDLAMCHRRRPEGFLVQDRHWLSQVSRNLFFHRDVPELPTRLIWSEHIPFTHNVYLTSDLATKRERARLRPPKSLRDSYLRASPERHQEYDDFTMSLLPADERWTIIDTSRLTPEEVAARVIAVVGPLSPELGAEVGAEVGP